MPIYNEKASIILNDFDFENQNHSWKLILNQNHYGKSDFENQNNDFDFENHDLIFKIKIVSTSACTSSKLKY